jgi:hypothetical protein
MLPFLLPHWETDATLRAAVQQSVQASLTSLGSAAALVGGEIDADVRAADRDVDAEGTLSASWTLSPLTTMVLEAEGSLATTYGVRADTRLIELDPFLFGQRLEDAAGGSLSLSLEPSARDGINVEGGYREAGALAADLPSAVGVDTHEAHAAVSWSRDLGPRDTFTPELSYAYTHYYHALLDTELHRGPADIHELGFRAALSHELGRGFFGTATAGASVGTPMPVLGSTRPIVRPDAGLSVRWTGRSARVTARYAYAYTSLGPRIGYGQQHSATLRVDVRPREGARHRDLMLHGTLRFAHGGAPLAADPEPIIPGMPPPRPASGTLTTTTLAAATRVDVPLLRGLALTSGADLRLVRGVVDPAPPEGAGHTEVRLTLTIGLAVTLSTDKRRTVTRDPEAEQEEGARRTAPPTPDERRGDRTRTSDERRQEEGVDQGWERGPE